MGSDDDREDELLRSVALQNAQSILAARQRVEDELVVATEALALQAEQLAHSLAMMRATLESSTDGILVTDANGEVTCFNKNYAEMWRIPPEIMASANHWNLVQFCGKQTQNPAMFVERVEAIYTGAPTDCPDVLELNDERVFERLVRVQLVEGRNVGRVWTFRDISERIRSAHTLEKQSEWLRVTVRSIGDGVITTDNAARVTSLNPVAEALTGWTQGDAQGLRLSDVFEIVNETTRVVVESPVVRCLREGQIVGLANHTVLIARDRTERAIDDSAAPIRDREGEIIGAVLIFRDVSEQRAAQTALLRAEKIARFLAEASGALVQLTDYEQTLSRIAGLAVPDFADWCAVDIKDPDGSVRRLAAMHSDPAKVRLAVDLHRRYPPHPADPRGVMNVLRTRKPEWLAEITDAMLVDGAIDEDHLRAVREIGLKSYICVPMCSGPKTLGTLTFVTAESGRKYDARDVRAAEDLADRAAIAIENSSLVAALRDSDQRKDEFLAMLAHELRNPLAPARNAVHILRAKAPAVPELQWATDVIDRQLSHMTRLVDDLLDVSRISLGKIELRKQRIGLASVLDLAVEASRPLIDSGRHTLQITLPPEPVFLHADSARLAQAFLNLLSNAAKYTEPGGHIALTAECVGESVVLRVTDTGVGIAPEMLPRIFDLFTQVDRSLDRSQGGLGVGLSLVRQLIEMHDGTVEAFSAGPGRGSEFAVRLPISRALSDKPNSEVAVPPAKSSARRILVVDDNRDAADGLAILLEMDGHEVQTAYDGLEAVELEGRFQPHGIFLDIGLPKLNGYDAARQIRERGRPVVLVALTGWGQTADRDRTREAGFDHHLTKPVDFEALKQLLADSFPAG